MAKNDLQDAIDLAVKGNLPAVGSKTFGLDLKK